VVKNRANGDRRPDRGIESRVGLLIAPHLVIGGALEEHLPIDFVEFAQNRFELSIPAREALDQGKHVLGNVAVLVFPSTFVVKL